ncbi:phage head morphogenesis protein [Treponema phagedenis]|uniref:phage head morphogenesis protein n=1 Tax=Treponema phagedenis TaxID=162 RepID=UPI0020918108|nr:phage minor head protein [Treponema phagedenis]
MEPKFRFRAFTVARLSECDHIEDVRKRLIQALEKGEGWQESWEEIESFTKNIRKPFLPGYWETVYRTNVQTAYTAGRLTQYASNPPYAWELLVIQDGRTTDICNNIASIAGNGKALKADHPFWTVYGFPPYHFNCRTTIRAVYDYEAGAGTDIVEPSIDEIKKDFMPQEGFGGNPIENGDWWRLIESMEKRIEEYGIQEEVEEQAKEIGVQDYILTKEDIENTPFKTTPKSVGAMERRWYIKHQKTVYNPEYDAYDFDTFIKQGTYVKGIKVIAEGKEIRDVNRLIKTYKHQNGSFTKAKDWYKVRGTAILVNEDGDEYRAEIHWYQCKNIGKVEIKQKRIIKVIHEGSK